MHADDSPESRYQSFLSAPSLAHEDITKVTLEAVIRTGLNPNLLKFALHNGMKDMVITGFIINVTYKDGSTHVDRYGNVYKNKEIDLFYNQEEALPLTCIYGNIPILKGNEIENGKPVFSIKEIRVRDLKKS